jgi:hypothetical protein
VGNGASVNWNGGDADSRWSGGGELEGRSQRKKKERGKSGYVTPLPYLYPRGDGRGYGGSAPLPRPFLQRFATWQRDVGWRFE